MVEIKRPIPRVLSRKRHVAPKRREVLPTRGILNQNIANMVTMTICASAMMINGIVFPNISSEGLKGVTGAVEGAGKEAGSVTDKVKGLFQKKE